MNSFIHSLISYKELEEVTPKLLEFEGFKDFLYSVDVSYGTYKDLETGMNHIVIKGEGNNYVVVAEFLDEKFCSIYKVFPPTGKKDHQAFEVFLGRVLRKHLSGHCMDLTMHWGKNELEMGGEK